MTKGLCAQHNKKYTHYSVEGSTLWCDQCLLAGADGLSKFSGGGDVKHVSESIEQFNEMHISLLKSTQQLIKKFTSDENDAKDAVLGEQVDHVVVPLMMKKSPKFDDLHQEIKGKAVAKAREGLKTLAGGNDSQVVTFVKFLKHFAKDMIEEGTELKNAEPTGEPSNSEVGPAVILGGVTSSDSIGTLDSVGEVKVDSDLEVKNKFLHHSLAELKKSSGGANSMIMKPTAELELRSLFQETNLSVPITLKNLRPLASQSLRLEWEISGEFMLLSASGIEIEYGFKKRFDQFVWNPCRILNFSWTGKFCKFDGLGLGILAEDICLRMRFHFNQFQSSLWTDLGSFPDTKLVHFLVNSKRCEQNLNVFGDRRVIKHLGTRKWSTVLFKEAVFSSPEPFQCLTLKLDQLPTNFGVAVGLCKASHDLEKCIGNTNVSWGFYFHPLRASFKLFFNERSLWQGTADRILTMGDVIELRVFRPAGSPKGTLFLQISLNGKDYGCDELISYLGEDGEDIFFAASLGSVGQAMTII